MNDPATSTVMIVDDEEIIVGAIQSLLELETDYRVLPFTSPVAALETLESESIHLIVADFMMPEMDGVTFLTHARERRPEATRVLLTGYADKQNAIRAINQAGLYHYLEKPWDNEAFMLILRNGIERSTMFLELERRMDELVEANHELAGFRERLIQAFL